MSNQNQIVFMPSPQVSAMSERLNIGAAEMHNIIVNTLMPSGKEISDEQFTTFLAVANEYQLNPLTKEIYAFPAKGGGIQPVVSIDGWLRIINSSPVFDGMEFKDHLDVNGVISAVTCLIYRSDRSRPVEVTEYLNECQGDTEDRYKNKTPWGKYPARMLRHKATIQAARYAFGLSGIIDPDEADRLEMAGVITKSEGVKDDQAEKDITPDQSAAPAEEAGDRYYSDTDFDKNLPQWRTLIEDKKKTASDIIKKVEFKALLTPEQQAIIKSIKIGEAA
jgi:phage recombination protein Bet